MPGSYDVVVVGAGNLGMWTAYGLAKRGVRRIAVCERQWAGFGATTRDGFTAMVEYTAPTFWMFMALVGFSLFIFRWREPGRHMPFHVPLYPLVPIVFVSRARQRRLHRVGRCDRAGNRRVRHSDLLAWVPERCAVSKPFPH